MQVYEPDIVMVLDDSLTMMPSTYEGLKEGGTIIMNTVKPPKELKIPQQAGQIALVDAAGISEEFLGRNIPNTAMLGAFAKITGLVDREILFREIEASFGDENRRAAEAAYDKTESVEV